MAPRFKRFSSFIVHFKQDLIVMNMASNIGAHINSHSKHLQLQILKQVLELRFYDRMPGTEILLSNSK